MSFGKHFFWQLSVVLRQFHIPALVCMGQLVTGIGDLT